MLRQLLCWLTTGHVETRYVRTRYQGMNGVVTITQQLVCKECGKVVVKEVETV